MSEPAAPTVTVEDLAKRIDAELAKLEVKRADLPQMVGFEWVSPIHPGAAAFYAALADSPEKIAGLMDDLRHRLVNVGKPFPSSPKQTVFAIFRHEDDAWYTVYALPVPTRYRVDPTSRAFSAETMTVDTFCEEIVGDFAELAGHSSSVAAATDRIVSFLREEGATAMADRVVAGEHLPADEEDEEDGEEDEKEPEAGGTTAP